MRMLRTVNRLATKSRCSMAVLSKRANQDSGILCLGSNMEKQSGIYIIENSVSGKVYIGQSSDLARRNIDHFSYLLRGRHDNRHLQNAYNKYGKKAFNFRVLLLCETWELTRYEQLIVDIHSPEILYNICTECVDSALGIRRTAETKEKISKANSGVNHPGYGRPGTMLGRRLSAETKEKISKANLGKRLSSETKKKISKARRGYSHTAESREKMSINHADFSGANHPQYGKRGKDSHSFGRTHTAEAKEKISKAKNKSNLSAETLMKMSKAQSGENNPMFGKRGEKHHNYGKSTPEETRKKISDSVKAYYANKKKAEDK